MIIKSLELENIRSYKKETIEFKEGINFLSGDIGSGKSSILQAIEFALFGFKKGDLEGFQLLRKGETTASIKLILKDKSREIEIFRIIKKAKKTDSITQESSYLRINENLIELSASELNAQVFELLNFPKEFLTKDKNLIYRFTIYTPQEQLKEIIFAESDKRLEVIRKIFAIDKYKQLQDAIFIYNTKIREDKKVFSARLEPKEKLAKEIAELVTQINQLNEKQKILLEKENISKTNIEKHKLAIEKRDELLEKLSKNLLMLEKKKSQIEELENQLKKIKLELSDKKETLNKLKNQNSAGQIETLKKQIELEKTKIEQLNKQKYELTQTIERLEKKDAKKEQTLKEINEFEIKIKSLKELESSFDYELTQKQLTELEQSILENKSKIKELEKIPSQIKTFETQITQNEYSLKELQKTLLEKEGKVANLSKIDFCENCLQKVEHIHKKEIENKIETEKNDLLKMIAQKEKDSINSKKKLEKLNEQNSKLQKYSEELIKNEQKIFDLKEKEKKEKEQFEKVKKLKDELKLTKLQTLQNEFKELEKSSLELKEKRTSLTQNSENILELNNTISKLTLELEKIKNLEKEKEKLTIEIDKLTPEEKSSIETIKTKEDLLNKITEFETKQNQLKKDKFTLNQNFEKLYENQRLISEKLSSAKTQIEDKTKYLNEKNKEINIINQIETKYKKLLETENFLNQKVLAISSKIEKVVFTKYYSEFSEEFENLFHQLIEDNEIDVRLDSEFSPIIEQNGYDIDIKNLSGGEKSSLAVAYRLGLKKIIENNLSGRQKLSLLILDEPTDGFSNEQIDRLGSILKHSNLKQTILVSHDEKIESIADSVLKIEKINHVSRIL